MVSREQPDVPAAAAFHQDARTKARCLDFEQRLSEALHTDGDPRLLEASILEVAPHPDVRALLVVVIAPTERHAEVDAALDAATQRLRAALRADSEEGEGPEITFALMSPPAVSS